MLTILQALLRETFKMWLKILRSTQYLQKKFRKLIDKQGLEKTSAHAQEVKSYTKTFNSDRRAL